MHLGTVYLLLQVELLLWVGTLCYRRLWIHMGSGRLCTDKHRVKVNVLGVLYLESQAEEPLVLGRETSRQSFLKGMDP